MSYLLEPIRGCPGYVLVDAKTRRHLHGTWYWTPLPLIRLSCWIRGRGWPAVDRTGDAG